MRFDADNVVHDEKTKHQHLVIFDNPLLGRVLMLDGVTQLCSRDEFIYHEMMAHMPLLALEAPLEVLIIGGGDGGVLREVLRHPSVKRVVLCELDAAVITLSKKFFPTVSDGAFDDLRVSIVIADGTQYVGNAVAAFDVILVDSTDPIGPGQALFTKSFYSDCKTALKPGGVLVTQNGVPFVQPEELRQSVQHFRVLFKDATAFLATTPSYVLGPLAYGWGSDRAELRQISTKTLARRLTALEGFKPRYYTPEVHVAAFALPAYVKQAMQAQRSANPAK